MKSILIRKFLFLEKKMLCYFFSLHKKISINFLFKLQFACFVVELLFLYSPIAITRCLKSRILCHLSFLYFRNNLVLSIQISSYSKRFKPSFFESSVFSLHKTFEVVFWLFFPDLYKIVYFSTYFRRNSFVCLRSKQALPLSFPPPQKLILANWEKFLLPHSRLAHTGNLHRGLSFESKYELSVFGGIKD